MPARYGSRPRGRVEQRRLRSFPAAPRGRYRGGRRRVLKARSIRRCLMPEASLNRSRQQMARSGRSATSRYPMAATDGVPTAPFRSLRSELPWRGHAACNDDFGVARSNAIEICHVEDHLEALFGCILDERARIDDDDVRRADIIVAEVTRIAQATIFSVSTSFFAHPMVTNATWGRVVDCAAGETTCDMYASPRMIDELEGLAIVLRERRRDDFLERVARAELARSLSPSI